MKKAGYVILGGIVGYLFQPQIKKGIDWIKGKAIKASEKLNKAAEEDEVPNPDEEEQPNPEEEED